ncbi:MAG: helix-turn-helix transcriptional regulator [Bdellovibrionota bacterium]
MKKVVMQQESNKLAQFLKEKRTLSGLSQKDVATKLGYSTSQFISNWERGISQPPINTLRTLASMYGVGAEQMFNVLLEETMIQVQADLKRKFYSKTELPEHSA